MGIKDLILNKGWAGNTISRSETAARLVAIQPAFLELLRSYDAFFASADANGALEALSALMPVLRADIGKVSETVHSSGGVAVSGAGSNATPEGPIDAARLMEKEKALLEALENEKDIQHQMRTRAVLGRISANAEERLRALGALTGS